MLQDILDSLPWGEILIGVAALALLLLKLANSKLKLLVTQVTPNGGSSLRDAINRIEVNVGELAAVNEAVQHLSRKPMFKTDKDGNCVWLNTAYTTVTGKDIEDLKGHGWLSVIHESFRDEVCIEWESAVHDKRRFDLDYKIVNTSTGEVRPVKCKAYPIIVNSEVAGYIGTWYLLDKELE